MTSPINKKNTYQCAKCGIHFRTWAAILNHSCVMDFAPSNFEDKKARIVSPLKKTTKLPQSI